MAVVKHKEVIHSGHFMISDFEPDVEDEEDIQLSVTPKDGVVVVDGHDNRLIANGEDDPGRSEKDPVDRHDHHHHHSHRHQQQQHADHKKPFEPREEDFISTTISVQSTTMMNPSGSTEANNKKEVSLNKLFRSMSIAYRHKLTSPKWNKFRGLRLRWKDKIRLNNLIWRCWHMQFVSGTRKTLCTFANPLEIDNHLKSEGGTLLEGKYWKRRMQTIKREYLKWRFYYKDQRKSGEDGGSDEMILLDNQIDWGDMRHMFEGSKDDGCIIMPNDVEADMLMESLFGPMSSSTESSLAVTVNYNNSFVNSTSSPSLTASNWDMPGFGVSVTSAAAMSASSTGLTSEYGPGTCQTPRKDNINRFTQNSDFIQPGLTQLQPNMPRVPTDLEDLFMDIDTQSDWGQMQASSTAIPTTTVATTGGKIMPSIPEETPSPNVPQQTQPTVQPSPQSTGKPYFLTKLTAPPIAAKPTPIPRTTSPAHLQVPLQQQHQPQPSVMDLATVALEQQQQQQQQCFPTNFTGQKRPALATSCKSEKRHSPKHRILHHREESHLQQRYASTPVDPQSIAPDNNSQSQLVQLLTPKQEIPRLHTIPPPPPSAAPQPAMSLLRTAGLVQPEVNFNNSEYKKQKKTVHMTSEQRRRGTIQNGFDELKNLLPISARYGFNTVDSG